VLVELSLHVCFAVEEQVECGETESVGLGKSTSAHGRVQVENAGSAVRAHGVQLASH
jgi:hypothetical protein